VDDTTSAPTSANGWPLPTAERRIVVYASDGLMLMRFIEIPWACANKPIGPLPCSRGHAGAVGHHLRALAVEGSTTRVRVPAYSGRGPEYTLKRAPTLAYRLGPKLGMKSGSHVSATEPPAEGEEAASADAATGLPEVARVLLADGSVGTTLARIVATAVDTIDGCDSAGVFVVKGGDVTAPAAAGALAAQLDVLQRELNEGPCLDALAQAGPVYAHDLAEASPWPAFARAAVDAGVRSSLSVHVAAGDTPAFGATDRAKAVMLAVLAGLALSAAEARQAEDARIANLEAALISRNLIGQAQGILMERERITADQAFDILRRASQHLNIKLRDVAQRLVDTGEGPS
jgi:ANTAR domain